MVFSICTVFDYSLPCTLFPLMCVDMPKKGRSDTYWRTVAENVAAKNHIFGRGERPPAQWRILSDIEKCPRHVTNSRRDAIGRRIFCLCGYHVS